MNKDKVYLNYNKNIQKIKKLRKNKKLILIKRSIIRNNTLFGIIRSYSLILHYLFRNI